jgi:hypothetical protein
LRKDVRTLRRGLYTLLQERMGWREEDVEAMMDSFEGFGFDAPAPWAIRMASTILAARSLSDGLGVFHLQQGLGLLADTQPSSWKNDEWEKCRARQNELLADILGPVPSKKLEINRASLTDMMINLAMAAYEHRVLPSGCLDFERLAIMADALEDAGCADDTVLRHLREQEVHVRGCWVLDLLLNRA